MAETNARSTYGSRASVAKVIARRAELGGPDSPLNPELLSPGLLPALVALLHSSEADQLFRLLWARVRDNFPAVLRWLGDRLIGKPAAA